MCVCLEGVHQECGKHISKANVSSFLVKNTDGLWFQLQWWEFFKNAENTLVDHLFLWKHISSYLIYSLR